jgi:hypothetical protein
MSLVSGDLRTEVDWPFVAGVKGGGLCEGGGVSGLFPKSRAAALGRLRVGREGVPALDIVAWPPRSGADDRLSASPTRGQKGRYGDLRGIRRL